MTTAYTSLLGLALPVTGELDGTWGDVVNNYITSYLDASVAGAQTISGSQTAVTLSTTNGSALSQAASGATGSAQYQIINCTGNPASLLTVTVPAASKQYIVINATSTSQSVKIVGAGPTTGVTIVSGEKALIAWDGSDFVKVASTVITNLTGTLGTANGGTGLTGFTASNNALYSTSSSALAAGTLPVAAGGTGQTSYTDGQLLIGNSSGNTLTKATLTAGSNVTITNGNGSITIASTATTSAGGSNTQVQYNSSGAFAGSSNFTFDGTNVTVGGTTSSSKLIPTGGTATGNGMYLPASNTLGFSTNGTLVASLDSAGNLSMKTGSIQEVKASVAASDINLSLGNYFSKTISGTTTFTVSNVPTTGTAIAIILDLTNGGSATVNWWSGVKWPSGTAPTLTASGRDVLGFFTYDGGTTWNGFVLGKAMA